MKVREAIEYAIDRPALAKGLGFGYLTPLKMIHPKGEWAYDEKWPGRPYNPSRAKQLLAEAGYPNGIRISGSWPYPAWGEEEELGKRVTASYLNQAGIDPRGGHGRPGQVSGATCS